LSCEKCYYTGCAEPTDTFQNALLPYDGGQGLHAEKEMMICYFKTCSVTMVWWSM